jgi:hypothetical protein
MPDIVFFIMQFYHLIVMLLQDINSTAIKLFNTISAVSTYAY